MASKHATSKRLSELTETFTQRANNKKPDVEAEAQYQIPLFGDLERAIPNHLARSSLFAPIARGRRKQHNGSELMSRNDVVIRYTGPQLDMGDQDVFMQALFEAQRVPLGERVFIKRSKFLQTLHRSTGKSDYKWLHDCLKRIFNGSIEIEAKNYKIGGTPSSAGIHLINEYDYDENAEAYYLTFNPRIRALFSNREYALVDWEKRHQITKRIDMAKWLQSYVATHQAGPHRIGVKYLKGWMDYSSPMNKFREALLEALTELARLEIIAGEKLEMGSRREEMAVWVKL